MVVSQVGCEVFGSRCLGGFGAVELGAAAAIGAGVWLRVV